MGDEGVEQPKRDAESQSLDPADTGKNRSLDTTIAVIKRTIPLLRLLRARADAALCPGPSPGSSRVQSKRNSGDLC
jgi:hypothetical protein